MVKGRNSRQVAINLGTWLSAEDPWLLGRSKIYQTLGAAMMYWIYDTMSVLLLESGPIDRFLL
jgi:hypothetical protein